LGKTVFREAQIPDLESVRENVDVSALDERHVLPNMGNVLVRGVWFPLGHDR